MKFKTPEVGGRFKDMCDLAKRIAKDAYDYVLKKYGIEITITATTSTLAEDKELGRESDTHRTRRAFDIRTYDLPDHVVADLIQYLNKKYGKYGAVASAIPQLIVNKPHGTGPHLHVQLNRKYALKEIDYGTN